MTTYPDDDRPRDPVTPDEPDEYRDDIPPHPKRDIIDPDYDDERRDADDRTVGEKVSAAAQELMGKAKQRWGELTDDERLEAEGFRQETEAQASREADRANDPER